MAFFSVKNIIKSSYSPNCLQLVCIFLLPYEIDLGLTATIRVESRTRKV